jgi:putative ABC transport system permease protein
MLKNYFIASLRNLMKNKVFSSINIVGLAIGMAACLLILQYVNFELSYDQFHANKDHLYRVVNDRYQNGKLIQHGTITYSAIGKAMKDDFKEVQDFTRVEPLGEVIIQHQDNKLAEEDALAVDPSFLEMFSFPLMAGDQHTALKQPYTAVVSQSLIRKIFHYQGSDFQQFLGKTLILSRDSTPYKITGICRDVPENSHLPFNLLTSYQSLIDEGWKDADYSFTDSDFWHYILLRPGTDVKAFQAKLAAFSQRHFQGNKVSGSVERFYLQPLSRAHLYSDFEYEIGKTGSATVVWGLMVIALLIIVIAWVNYVNLTTAKAMERAKEVGIRKVVGASKKQLIGQFLTESLFLNSVALLLAIFIVLGVQQGFNQLVQHQLSLKDLLERSSSGHQVTSWLILLLSAGVLLSGFYPAFVLSSYKPIVVLKGRFSASRKGILFRKALVVGQFALTVGLIIGSLVVYRQLRYMNKQELGFSINQTLIIKPPILTAWDSTFINKENAFKEEVKQLPHVKAATASGRVPGDELGRTFNVRRSNTDAATHFTVRNLMVNYDFIQVYGIQLLAGRNFTPSDHNPDFNKLHNIILNQTAVKLLGFSSPQEAIGQTVTAGDRPWEVIGVVADFHQKSLRYPLEPTLLVPAYTTNGPISVKLDPSDLAATLSAIKKKYEAFFPGNLFDYYFLDERFNKQYKNEELFGKVFGLFAGLAIFIACLGLLGLSLFTTAQRTKEIGVRKVLGASVANILFLLSREFIRLILISFLVAAPLAWWVMRTWLQDFAYRTAISWWIFLLAGFLALIIAITTITTQAIKAATLNPVKSLRTE